MARHRNEVIECPQISDFARISLARAAELIGYTRGYLYTKAKQGELVLLEDSKIQKVSGKELKRFFNTL